MLDPTKPIAASALPNEVKQAMACDWGVFVDAYLINAARVGTRYAALAYGDQSGLVSAGMTVVTPPVRQVSTQGPFRLLKATTANDFYVLVTELREEGDADGDAY